MKKVTPKKHLGQHFLKDDQIAGKIVDSLQATGQVLEIGPGTGVLTRLLLEKGFERFLAFDVDQDSISYLREAYPEYSSSFVLEDFLQYDLRDFAGKFSIIGNFPYNISSQLFFKIWTHRDQVEEVVCMVQKEVAQRIVAREGNKTYGILSVLLQAFYDIKYLFSVPPHVFIPPPKVQSGVIRLTRNATKTLPCDESLFKRVVKAGFGKRRKTLRNALKDLNLDFDAGGAVFDRRAEQLSVSEFIDLTNYISQ